MASGCRRCPACGWGPGVTRDPAQTVVILPAERAVQIDGEIRQIGARAFDVLAYLDAHSGRVVTKAELLEHVWADLNVEESNLTVQIAALRKLIGARAIATVPGVGLSVDPYGQSPGRTAQGAAAAGQTLARGAALRQPDGRCGQGVSGGRDRGRSDRGAVAHPGLFRDCRVLDLHVERPLRRSGRGRAATRCALRP